jgi:hypothetical protein
MPEPSAAVSPVAPASQRRNVFLDDAVTPLDDAGYDADGAWAVTAGATPPLEPATNPAFAGGRRVRARRHGEHRFAVRFRASAALAAIAAAAIALPALTLSSSGDRPQSTDAARPIAAPPKATERPDARRSPDASQRPGPRPEPPSGSDSRSRPTAPAKGRRGARRRDRTGANAGSPPVAPGPAPSVAPAPPPSARPRPPRAQVQPAPVPTDAPPEFM